MTMRPCADCGDSPGHDRECPALRRDYVEGPEETDWPDYGGAYDGNRVISDADPGL